MTKVVYRKITVNGIPTWTADCTFDCGIAYCGTSTDLNRLLTLTASAVAHDPCLEPC